MKLSLKVQDQQQNQNQNQNPPPVLLRAKVPITVFGLQFLSGLTAADNHPSDLTLSVRTNFSSGPSLKLSYSPTHPSPSTTPPLTLTLKSGVSLSGSPANSPLVISAKFSFSSENPNPTFSLQFKPQFGDFSLRKTILSNPTPNPKPNGDTGNSIGFVPLDRPMFFKDLTMVESSKDSVLSGIAVMANTRFPLTKRVGLNLRWGVNLPSDMGKQFPVLSVNKIQIERVDEVKQVREVVSKKGNDSDVEMLKGMYTWMRRELDVLQKENMEMKGALEEMKLRRPVNNGNGYGKGVAKKVVVRPSIENAGGFEQWRSKKSSGGEDNGQKESKESASRTSDVESELQKAIKAASS